MRLLFICTEVNPLSIAGVLQQRVSVATSSLRWWTLSARYSDLKFLCRIAEASVLAY